MASEATRLTALRERLETGVSALGMRIFSAGVPRLPNTVFFAAAGLDGETLVARLDRAGYACASGSACSSAQPEPSHTLLAMGVEPDMARAAVRVSMGRDTETADVEGFLAALVRTVNELNNLTAVAVES